MSAARARTVALIVASALFIQNLDAAVIVTSLPQMGRDFGLPAANLSLGVTTYILASASFMPLASWLADRLGARNVFATAIAVFMLGSLACALAPNLAAFAAARVIQGLGAALMTPVGRAVVLRNTAKSDILNAIAMITWPALIAPVIGPALGGFITEAFGWRWNFAINLPLGAAGLTMALIFVPNLKAEIRAPLDVPGLALVAGAISAAVYGLETLGHDPAGWPISTGLVGLAGLLWWAAWRRLNRVAHPLIQPGLFSIPTFRSTILTAGMFSRLGIAATPFLLPLLFQLVFGRSALRSGLMILVYFFGNLSIKVVTTPLLRRFGFRLLLVVNGVLSGLCICAFAGLTAQTPLILTGLLLYLAGATRSTQFTALNSLSFADVPDKDIGSATTLSTMAMQVAGCLGVAVAAVILALMRGPRAHQTNADFQVAFLVVGLLTALVSLLFAKLDRDAGRSIIGEAR